MNWYIYSWFFIAHNWFARVNRFRSAFPVRRLLYFSMLIISECSKLLTGPLGEWSLALSEVRTFRRHERVGDDELWKLWGLARVLLFSSGRLFCHKIIKLANDIPSVDRHYIDFPSISRQHDVFMVYGSSVLRGSPVDAWVTDSIEMFVQIRRLKRETWLRVIKAKEIILLSFMQL